jgi:hypothetical protein
MQCCRCQQENPGQAQFCLKCGSPLTATPSGAPAPSYSEITTALTEAFEQQTATAEILRLIASSPTDLQPVFDAIAESAVRVCDGLYSAVYRVDEDYIHLVALNESRPR